MALHLYDSATKQVRKFEPLKENEVSIYLCGATVQGSPHIGHMRSSLVFDVLVRWLRRRKYNVTLVRNVTDIDDKILVKSAEAGENWWVWALKFEREFTEAYNALGVLPPTYEPRATGHVTDMIELIQILIDRGHAYSNDDGNVYFSVRSLKDYGTLTNQNIDDLATTEDDSQIDGLVESGKRDACDFALWKAVKPTEPQTASWDTPWGRGRPGWHLECSAMSKRYLGESFDIHGGGIDLRFPHHENEQAQSHGAGWGFANHWIHNAWVTIKGEKMSKSLGNSLIVSHLLEETPAPVLRLALGTVHYRSTVEFSEQSLHDAQLTWDKFTNFVERAAKFAGQVEDIELDADELPQEFVNALDDDLNLASAMATIHEWIKLGNKAIADEDAENTRKALLYVRSMLDILGLDPLSPVWSNAGSGNEQDENAMKALDTLVHRVLEDRQQARAEKDWAKADSLRDLLVEAGIVVEDGANGASWHLG
ncbi:cysteine--tRNA ligase [Actinomyces sp. zg-332]|uniref:cysteine--tRNA ligase n=1 Tax=Actinomyces sp. zg-332 TaxID=2708340 RepID=UPI001422551C|nr:cysteine--tRNA ligase [Actinomyces sp. zg-332]QPK94189.1 cysteine--tRNA ligase [Actinomyces sp. zg-332]